MSSNIRPGFICVYTIPSSVPRGNSSVLAMSTADDEAQSTKASEYTSLALAALWINVGREGKVVVVDEGIGGKMPDRFGTGGRMAPDKLFHLACQLCRFRHRDSEVLVVCCGVEAKALASVSNSPPLPESPPQLVLAYICRQ